MTADKQPEKKPEAAEPAKPLYVARTAEQIVAYDRRLRNPFDDASPISVLTI